MFGTKDEKYSDIEVAEAYWKRVQQRMEWCRNEASEYLKNHPRKKHYKITYNVDPGNKTTYAPLYDFDIKLIRETIENDIAENGPYKDEEERADAMHDLFLDLDLCWESYIPFDDLHWAGGPPTLVDVDFDDVIYCCTFKVKTTESYKEDKEELVEHLYDAKISDEEFVDLVAAKLFDDKLTFYDLRYLYEDVYNRIMDLSHSPHHHHIVFMKEINDVAKAIMDGTPKENRPQSLGDSNPFIPVVLNIIFKNQDHFDDKKLLQALNIATTY